MSAAPQRSEILAQAVEIVNNARVGLLTTVDADSVPHARWMGIGALVEGVRVLYTVSRADARKVRQIEARPEVCWVFSEPGYRRIATLYGRAYPDHSPILRQKVWDHVFDRHLLYCLQREECELVVLATIVDRVELSWPDRPELSPAVAELAAQE